MGLSDYESLARSLARGVRGRVANLAGILGWRREIVFESSPTGGPILGGKATTTVSPSDDVPLEVKVEFLVRESKRTQERLSDLEYAVADLPARWRRDITSTREALEQRIERRLTEMQEKYLMARRIGLVCLLLGVTLVSASAI